MLELRRSDIGFGRLIIDDAGVTRRRIVRTERMCWDEILGYRLGAAPKNATGELGFLFGGLGAAIDFEAALRGAATGLRLSCQLIAADYRLMVNWRFANVELAIREIMRRIGPRLLASSRWELEQTGAARFGELEIGARGVAWKGRHLLPFDVVESIGIVDDIPLRAYVRQRGRSFPYAKFALDDIPNVLVAFEIGRDLGYRVDALKI